MSENTVNRNRIYYIDFLKCVGLILIIFAHVGAPEPLTALRTFDVPLMVIISSLLAGRSYKQKKGLPLNYFIRRIQRLVIPTWILLVIYFLLQYLLKDKIYPVSYYLYSFALTRYGAGYVWIILIYLYCALLVPLFSRLRPTLKAFTVLAVIYTLYEIALYYGLGTENRFIDTFFYYIIPYGCLSFAGYSYEKLSPSFRKALILLSFLIFSVTAIVIRLKTGSFQSPGSAKYPPQLYYMSYGFFVSFLLLYLCSKKENLSLYRSRAVQYISSHSLWLYLWHIIALLLYEVCKLPEIWYVKLTAVTMTAFLLTLSVNKLLDLIERKRKYPFLRYFRG